MFMNGTCASGTKKLSTIIRTVPSFIFSKILYSKNGKNRSEKKNTLTKKKEKLVLDIMVDIIKVKQHEITIKNYLRFSSWILFTCFRWWIVSNRHPLRLGLGVWLSMNIVNILF